MPALAERRETRPSPAEDDLQGVAAAMTKRGVDLVTSLSGGSGTWYWGATGRRAAERLADHAGLPSTMLQPVAFDDSDGDDLTVVHLVAANEDDDHW